MNSRRRFALSYAPSGKLGRLYSRELPGGGYVALDVLEQPSHVGGRFVGRITVERRAEIARREGCAPPVVAELRADCTETLLHRLLPVARSNAAIGAALLHPGTVTNGL
jgi:hypothetical protein